MTSDTQAGAVRLRPPRHRVDARAVRWWTAQALVVSLPPIVALAVLAATLPPARPWLLLGLVILVVPAVAYLAVVPRWRYWVHRWETTERAVYARSGWFWQQWRVAPMSRIQTVDSMRGPLERFFQLATVTVTTASSAGAIKIAGLDRELAADLVEQLTATTEATHGDAT